jgi:hypothetical protein
MNCFSKLLWWTGHDQRTMYVVIERFSCVGLISSTPVRTFRAGKKVVAPNGEINAETETRNIIHILEPGPQMVYGGSEGCRCN